MGRVGAIDHEVGGPVSRGGIHILDGLRQGVTGRQAPIEFHRERDDDGDTDLGRRPDDANGLRNSGQGHRGDEIGSGFGQHLDLNRVVGLGLFYRHGLAGVVTVASRTDTPADDDRADPFGFGLVSGVASERGHRVPGGLRGRIHHLVLGA